MHRRSFLWSILALLGLKIKPRPDEIEWDIYDDNWPEYRIWDAGAHGPYMITWHESSLTVKPIPPDQFCLTR